MFFLFIVFSEIQLQYKLEKSNIFTINCCESMKKLHASLLLSLLTACVKVVVSASSSCVSDKDCSISQVCAENRCETSNKYETGCFHLASNMTSKFRELGFTAPKQRTCNSDDEALKRSECIPAVFPYEEVRIAPGDWESSVVVSILDYFSFST